MWIERTLQYCEEKKKQESREEMTIKTKVDVELMYEPKDKSKKKVSLQFGITIQYI